MIWLLYGARGWIGGMVKAYISSVYPDHIVVEGVARVDDETSVSEEMGRINPDRVISTIGRTHGPGYSTIDYLEQKGKLEENIRDNLYGPMVLAMLCKKYNKHFTYLGTGCIFTYDQEHQKLVFDEQDRPNFTGSGYSTVKGFTDRLMHFFEDQVLNLRIRMPIIGSDNPRNFITKIVSYPKICSIPNSMTVLDDLIPVMVEMAIEKVTGTYNLTNPGVIDHNQILEWYKQYVDPSHTWENFTIQEQDQVLLSKRSNNELDTHKLDVWARRHNQTIPTIRESVEKLLQRYGK